MLRVRVFLILSVFAPALRFGDNASANTVDDRALNDGACADAALLDVHFVSPTTGWVVGERGVVWHTKSGGKTWTRQTSGVTCRLAGVRFLNENVGWAVGGSTLAYSKRSRGVVLNTVDGGRSWRPAERLLVPVLDGVRFFDASHGVAFGRSSAAFPAAIWITADGGQNWRQAAPPAGDNSRGWLAGDFLDPRTGAVGGSDGRVAVVSRQSITPLAGVDFGNRNVHAICLQPNGNGWLVGDGGLVRTTTDAGYSWKSPEEELPEAVRSFDLHAADANGPHIWVAGTPGTTVFLSHDGGRSWQSSATDNHAPICAICFIDAERGWAVGELGTILATVDGGRTWMRQRAGGERAALLAVYATPRDVPLEALARLGAADGYLAAVETLFRPVGIDRQSNRAERAAAQDQSCPPEIARDAMLAVGATALTTAWQFRTQSTSIGLSSKQIWANLNRLHDGQAAERIEKRLVWTIRTWRPDVIVTHMPDVDGAGPLGQIVGSALLGAVDASADPTRYIDLATEAGLGAWQVKKVFGLLPPGTHGSVRFSGAELDTRLGRTLGELTAGPRAMIDGPFAPNLDQQHFRLLRSTAATTGDDRRLFAGISLQPGGGARREQPMAPTGDLQTLRKLAQKRRNMRTLIARDTKDAAWSAQINDLTSGLDPQTAAELLFQLAGQYRTNGRWFHAERTFEQLAARYPAHPLADVALEWLVSSYASGETGRRAAIAEAVPVRRAVAAGSELETSDDRLGGRSAEQAAFVEAQTDRLARAIALGNHLKRSRPLLYAEPPVRLPLAVAARKRGFTKDAGRAMLTLQHRAGDAYWKIAQTERWLSERGAVDRATIPPPKPILSCRYTPRPPFLDGVLDEPVWKTAKPVELASNQIQDAISSNPQSKIRLAYDDRFLYLSVRCQKIDPFLYPIDDRPRPRDADLSEHDRVTIHLDIDRDYATYWSLTVDHRGWTHDACWGDATWNPDWFVAATSDETTWTVEAAIRLSELTANPAESQGAWSVGVGRIIPGAGMEGWPGPCGDPVQPQQFGLLLFRR